MIKTAINTDLIDRKIASRLLKMSLRTIDRYRQSGRLSTTVVDNKIYLDKEEVEGLMNRHTRQGEKTYLSIDKRKDTVDRRQDKQEDDEDRVDGKTDRETDAIRGRHEREYDLTEYYKKMYEELLEEVRQQQKKLETAHYRVGQLEGQLRYSVPLIEYQQETKKLLAEGHHYKKMLMEREENIKKARNDFYIERLNKRIYLAIVLGLILLQPLWIFLTR